MTKGTGNEQTIYEILREMIVEKGIKHCILLVTSEERDCFYANYLPEECIVFEVTEEGYSVFYTERGQKVVEKKFEDLLDATWRLLYCISDSKENYYELRNEFLKKAMPVL